MGVRLMEHDRNVTMDVTTQDFRVKEVIRHMAYSTMNYNNDIALIKIDGEINFDDRMRPVCLAERGDIYNLYFKIKNDNFK